MRIAKEAEEKHSLATIHHFGIVSVGKESIPITMPSPYRQAA
jgi:molybdopterin synthase catalytic subunit